MLLYFLLGLLIAFYFVKSFRKPRNFPPGPPRLPVVGSIPFILGSGERPSIFHGVRQLVEKHGKILSFYIGSEPFVVISDYDLLKDLFKREETSDRPPMLPFNEIRPGHDFPGMEGTTLGVIFSKGEVWREQRRFVSRNLRDFGFGKSSMEDMLHHEIDKLLSLMSRQTNKSLSLANTLNVSVINALWTILVGESLELEDPRLHKIVVTLSQLLSERPLQPPLGFMLPSPQMLKLPVLKDIGGWTKTNLVFKSILALVEPQVKSHLDRLDQDDPKDLMDVLLGHVQKTTDEKSSFFGKVGMNSISNIMLDLFIAGMETTSSTLVWTFLYMIHFPEMQEKVFQEIAKVVGLERLPSLIDQDSMPFTNAVLQESLRFTGFVPLGAPHHTSKDIQVGEFVIPAKTTLMSNLYHIMNDPEYWKSPEEFNPDRFIDGNGKFVKDERVIPFSVGKRYCLGQSLAEMEFFLFFTAIVQRFRMSRVKGSTLPGLEVTATNPHGVTRTAPPYEVFLERR